MLAKGYMHIDTHSCGLAVLGSRIISRILIHLQRYGVSFREAREHIKAKILQSFGAVRKTDPYRVLTTL